MEGDLVKNYLADIRENDTRNPFAFWKERRASYSKIAPIAEDLLSAPASHACVERIFSVCGILTDGRRNHMKKSLEMRMFLKLNKDIL